MGTHYDIAIVGGGFSGNLVLYHLVHGAQLPLRIAIIDPTPHFPRGLAYANIRNEHLLNVRAGRMGAIDGQLLHFYQWCISPHGQAACAKIGYIAPITPQDFLPRRLYGEYLEAIYAETLGIAAQNGVQVAHITTNVLDVDSTAQGHTVLLHSTLCSPPVGELSSQSFIGETEGGILNSGSEKKTPPPTPSRKGRGEVKSSLPQGEGNKITTTRLVLAVGNAFGGALTDAGRYVQQPWNFPYETLEQTPENPYVIVGTGLTAVDTMVSLLNAGCTNIIAISRNGWLPAPHVDGTLSYDQKFDLAHLKGQRLSHYTRAIRNEVRAAAMRGQPWQVVIDALRPHTHTIWRQLTPHDQKRFAHRLLTLWNIHRHRMAEGIAAQLAAAIDDGRIFIQKGRVLMVEPHENELPSLEIDLGATKGGLSLVADHIFECVGPKFQATDYQLLDRLLAKGTLSKPANSMGIAMVAGHRVSAPNLAPIYAIGTPLVGELLETIAVPELRGQAKLVAEGVLRT